MWKEKRKPKTVHVEKYMKFLQHLCWQKNSTWLKTEVGTEGLFPFAYVIIDSGFSLFLLFRYEVFTGRSCWQPLIITSMYFVRLWKGSSWRFTWNAQGIGGLNQLKNPSSTSILLYFRQTYWDVELKTLNQRQGTLKCPPRIPLILHQPLQWNGPLLQKSWWKVNFPDFNL